MKNKIAKATEDSHRPIDPLDLICLILMLTLLLLGLLLRGRMR